MSLSDFTKYFYILTVCFANDTYQQTFVQDQCFSYKWGAFEIDMPTTEKNCFCSLFQQNDRFMGDGGQGENDYEYPEMMFILTKVIKIPPKTGQNTSDRVTGECAYIDGVQTDLYNTMSLKVDKMTAGKYLCFYKADWKQSQLCRRMNTIFYSPHKLVAKRISARKFGSNFLDELERRHFKRWHTENYK